MYAYFQFELLWFSENVLIIIKLMPFRSATVDSTLFSSYFGHCPVLTAQGRTHPVTTYFLEDIYESINYHLASDSPAALRYETSTINKVVLHINSKIRLWFLMPHGLVNVAHMIS